MTADPRVKITVYFDPNRGEEVTRADYFGKKGSSTQTCRSFHEAHIAINKFRRKDDEV